MDGRDGRSAGGVRHSTSERHAKVSKVPLDLLRISDRIRIAGDEAGIHVIGGSVDPCDRSAWPGSLVPVAARLADRLPVLVANDQATQVGDRVTLDYAQLAALSREDASVVDALCRWSP